VRQLPRPGADLCWGCLLVLAGWQFTLGFRVHGRVGLESLLIALYMCVLCLLVAPLTNCFQGYGANALFVQHNSNAAEFRLCLAPAQDSPALVGRAVGLQHAACMMWCCEERLWALAQTSLTHYFSRLRSQLSGQVCCQGLTYCNTNIKAHSSQMLHRNPNLQTCLVMLGLRQLTPQHSRLEHS
jgi:hypothetical protein